jgi:hypothetical protein
MPRTYRRSHPYSRPRLDPPPLLPVDTDDAPRPARWRAAPLADRVLGRLRSEGESTLAEVLGGFDAEEWCGATAALDGLVDAGRVVMRVGYRDGSRSGWRVTINFYRVVNI